METGLLKTVNTKKHFVRITSPKLSISSSTLFNAKLYYKMQQQNGTYNRGISASSRCRCNSQHKELTALKKHPFTFDNEIILPRTSMCILKAGMCSKAKPWRRVITEEMGRGLLNRYRKTRTLGGLKQTNKRAYV